MYNSNSTILEITADPLFAGFSEHIFPKWDLDTITFENLRRYWEIPETTLSQIIEVFPSWSIDSLVSGINYLHEMCRKNELGFYQVYGENKTENADDVVLFHFPVKNFQKHIIICPGGGYESVCSIAEGFPIARAFNSLGFGVFILKYRTYPYAEFLHPQDDLAAAVSFITNHANQMKIDFGSYAVCGFSAGGHLAASWGTDHLGFRHYNLPAPKCLVLAYPVITMARGTHKGSQRALLGSSPSSERITMTSLEKQIDPYFPPVFLWHCLQDDAVSFTENSNEFISSLRSQKVKNEFLPIDYNMHGIGAGLGTPAEGWMEKAVSYMETL